MDFLNQIGAVSIIVGALSAAVIGCRPYLGLLTMVLMIPFEPIVTLPVGVTAIKVVGIITFVSCAFHIVVGRERIQAELKLILPLIVFLCWAMVGLGGNYGKFLTLAQLILFFVLLNTLCHSNKRRIDLLIWTYIIACLIATFVAASEYLSSPFHYVRGAVEHQNANLFANIIGVGICLLLFVRSRYRGYKMLIPYGIGIALIYALIIASSRSGVVAMAMALFVYLVMNRNRLKSAANILIICLLVGTVLFVGLRKGLISEFTVKRIESTKNYEETTLVGRFWLWHGGWKMIKDNFLTGVGLGNFPVEFHKYAGKMSGAEYDPHNTYLSLFAETGAIGFLIVLWFMGTLFYTLIKAKGENKIFSMSILVFVATFSLTGTTHWRKVFWFSLSVAYLLLNYAQDRKSRSSLALQHPGGAATSHKPAVSRTNI